MCVFCCFIVAAQNYDPLRTILTVRPAGQNVELMCTLRQPSRENNETIGWIINLSVVYGVSFLSNSGVRGYSADLLSNNLIIKNITMNDNRNTTEYQCVIHISMGHLGHEEVVESGDIIILHVAGGYSAHVMVCTYMLFGSLGGNLRISYGMTYRN